MYDFFLRSLSCPVVARAVLIIPCVDPCFFLLFDLFALPLRIHAIRMHAPGVCFVLA